MSREPRGSSRILVLCVDRDDDVGVKAKIATPVVGRDKCFNAASLLALADPEEADSNAIFAAIKEYDALASKGYECEIALVSGFFERGVEGDEKIRRQLKEVASSFDADGLIFVSDGIEDEEVLPILQNILPIISVRRVVIKHSRTVEESYLILGRYLRMLIYDPRYSKLFLGVPGFLLIAAGLLVYFGMLREALVIMPLIIGVAFVIRAFDLDKLAASITKMRPSSYLRAFTILTTVLILTVAFFQAFVLISKTTQFDYVMKSPLLILSHGPYLLGLFLTNALPLTWIGLGVNFVGHLLYRLIRQSMRWWRDALGILMLVVLYLPVLQFSQILVNPQQNALTLVSLLLVGLAVTGLVVTVVYQYIRSRRRVSEPQLA